MRVLLTGGTGFVGRALSRALADRADEVVVVSRRGEAAQAAGARAIRWDLIESEVRLADAVVHLAGEPVADGRWTKERLGRIRSSRVDTTARIARAIATAPRKPRVLVSASAVGFYGMRRDDAVLTEEAPAGDDVLAEIVRDWEAAAKPASEAGVRVAHPRIGVVLGAGGGALAKMAPAFLWFVGGPVGSGKQWMSWIHLRDVVRAILFAVDHEAVAGPFNATAPEPLTMDVFAHALGRVLGRPAAVRVPEFALRVALGDGLARMLSTGQRAVPRKLLDAGFAFDFTRLEEALRDALTTGRASFPRTTSPDHRTLDPSR